MRVSAILVSYSVLLGLSMSAKSLQLCWTLWDPMDLSHQAPLSTGFSRQEYWSGLPFPPPGDLPGLSHVYTFLNF